MKLEPVLALSLLIALSACQITTPEHPLPVKKQPQNNKTAQLLSGKRLTSLVAYTYMGQRGGSYYWCQNSGHVGPDEYRRIKSGICYSQTTFPQTLHLRELSLGSNGDRILKFPKASSAELEQLKQDLIKMDFASIQSMPGKPDVNKGAWQTLFCYEDPAKPQERAKCMEATNPLTHPKTDAVMQMLKRFARGNSMSSR